MRRATTLLLLFPPASWSLLAVSLQPWASGPVRITAAAAYVVALAAALVVARRSRSVVPLFVAVAAGIAAGVALRAIPEPSNNREWMRDQSRLATAEIDGDRLTIRNLRAFRHAAGGSTTPAWEDRTYDLSRLDSVWFAISPFSSIPGVGHVFVSFGFEGRDFVAISVEARKRAGERYSPLRGMFRNYELAYVVGRESDLMYLRSDVWRDRLYLYPVRATRDGARRALLSMLGRANALAERPEFYDTVLSSCSSNLAAHVNEVAPGRIPASLRILLAGFSDELAFELGLLDVEGDLAAARARYLVAPGADPTDPGYSIAIRRRPGS